MHRLAQLDRRVSAFNCRHCVDFVTGPPVFPFSHIEIPHKVKYLSHGPGATHLR
jgi:hypothetical protein